MLGNIVVEPMTEMFLLWRCLHYGALSRQNIDLWPKESDLPWQRYRERNVPLLQKLTRTYGACAILARDGEMVIGHLRFYPKVVWQMKNAGSLCLLQDYPAGPTDNLADTDFPPPEKIEDKTLVIHCLMTGCSQLKENPYQRKGIASRLVKTLIQWAQVNEWKFIEVDAFEDLPIIYEITGSAGQTFWEKLGFSLIDRQPHPYLQGQDEFVQTLEKQAMAVGIPPQRAKDRLVMRVDLPRAKD